MLDDHRNDHYTDHMNNVTSTWPAFAMVRPVCNIGQLNANDLRALNAAVKSGALVKRQAPFAGRLGAMKTYYAASDQAFDAYQVEQISKFDLCIIMDEHNKRNA
jgi:hypothetical protein